MLIKGYQRGTPYAFYDCYGVKLSQSYLDGVIFKRYDVSTKKGEHVWSYAGGRSDKYKSNSACPCNKGAIETAKPPSFVGNNYYCESGTSKTKLTKYDFFPNDPLWDGKGFNNLEGPCRKDMMPYFKRTYDSAITDDISVSLCRVSYESEQDVYLEGYGIFVK